VTSLKTVTNGDATGNMAPLLSTNQKSDNQSPSRRLDDFSSDGISLYEKLNDDSPESPGSNKGGKKFVDVENNIDRILGAVGNSRSSGDDRLEAEHPRLPPLRNSNDSEKHQIKVTYVGSMTMTDDDLKSDSNQAVRKCIAVFSTLSTGSVKPSSASSSNKKQQSNIIHEWTEGTAMQLVLDEDSVSLRGQNNNSAHAVPGSNLVSHELHRIRVWGTGKEQDSPLFAYVTRDDPREPFICRVLKCSDVIGQHVSNVIKTMCELRLSRKQQETTTNRNKLDSASGRSSSFEEAKVSMQCQYVGHMTIPDSTGKAELKQLVESKISTPKESWTRVTMELSKSGITVKDYKNSNLVHVDCSVECLKFYGVYSVNNRFCTMHVQKPSGDCEMYVFHFESAADLWCTNVQAVVKPNTHSDDKGTMRKKLQKLFTGGKKKEER